MAKQEDCVACEFGPRTDNADSTGDTWLPRVYNTSAESSCLTDVATGPFDSDLDSRSVRGTPPRIHPDYP